MKILTIFFILIVVSTSTLFSGENPWGTLTKQTVTLTMGWSRRAIEGYALPTSLKPGETIKFYVSVCDSGTQHLNYKIKIFRIPDITTPLYTSSVNMGRFYYLHDASGSLIGIGDYSRKAVDFKKGCTKYWDSTAISFSVPSNWQSGLYIAQLEHQSSTVTQKEYYVPFIVRAATAGSTSKILFKFDFNTSQAYSKWGGGSLYSKAQDTSLTSLTKSDTIAIDRPLDFDFSESAKFYYANQFIKTLEDSGMVMEYCNNIDIDSLNQNQNVEIGLNLLNKYKTLVLWNHDEYWTQNERDNTEKFMGRGDSTRHGNIARFSPNTCYWRIQWLNNSHLQLSCNKWWDGIAYNGVSQFRVLTPTNPEGKFLGSQYQHNWNAISGDSATEEPPDSVVAPTHWIFRGTGLNYGDTLGYGRYDGRWHGLVAGEIDNTIQQYGKADHPTTILAKRYVRSHGDNGVELVLHQMIYYEDTTTNARVYGLGASGMPSALGADAYSSNDRNRVKQMTVNIMSHFAEKKYIGNVYTDTINFLVWNNSIRLDGNVNILQKKKLRIDGTVTVTIDSVFFVTGELEINGNVTVAGGGSLNINPTGKLRLKANSTLTVNPATFIMEAGAQIIYESGAKLVLNQAVIESGATLNVSSGGWLDFVSGGAISFGTGSGLYSYGKVTAANALFTSTGSQSPNSWGNIVFDGNGADYSNLNYCKVERGGEVQCLNGADVFIQNSNFRKMNRAVYFNNSAPWILSNNIDSMSVHAIEGTTNYQDVSLYWNRIKRGYSTKSYAGYLILGTNGNIIKDTVDGFDVGMFFNGGSSPHFIQGNENNPIPNNKITNNNNGVEVAWGSGPDLGDNDDYVAGNNSIYNNSNRNIYARNSSSVWAENNFFGCGSPNNYAESGSYIYTDVILTEDPFGEEDCGEAVVQAPQTDAIKIQSLTLAGIKNGGTGRQLIGENTIKSKEANAQFSTQLSGLRNEMRVGLRLKKMKMFPEAVEHFKAMYSSNKLAIASLGQLTTLYNDSVDYGVYDFIMEQKDVASEHQTFIKRIAAKLTHRRIDYKSAEQLYNDIIVQSPQSEEAKDAWFQKFYAALFEEKDKEKAATLLEEIKSHYSEEDVVSARYHFDHANFIKDASLSEMLINKPIVQKKYQQIITKRPLQFELSTNYPNPFNPSTTIAYTIPEANTVNLIVYDNLGREVTRLVNGYKTEGKYEVVFNADRFASGLYFYKLNSGRYSAIKKMLLLK